MTRLDQMFLALHIFGVIGWVGGHIGVGALLGAFDAETDSGARQRLVDAAKKRAMAMDSMALVAIAFGVHWLVKFKLYTQPWMHIKLTLVVAMLGLHGVLRAGVKKAGRGERALPAWVPAVGILLGLAIVMLVVLKVPAKS